MDAAGDVQQWTVEQGVVALQSAYAVAKVRYLYFGIHEPYLPELTDLGSCSHSEGGRGALRIPPCSIVMNCKPAEWIKLFLAWAPYGQL